RGTGPAVVGGGGMAGSEERLQENSSRKSPTEVNWPLRFYVHDVFSVLHRVVFWRLRFEPLPLGKDPAARSSAGLVSQALHQCSSNDRARNADKHSFVQITQPCTRPTGNCRHFR